MAALAVLTGITGCIRLSRDEPFHSWPLPSHPEDGALIPAMLADPLEPMNRLSFSLDKTLLAGVLEPVARGYNDIVPKRARLGLRHFRQNLFYPRRLANNLLQANWPEVGSETQRFVINTSAGVLGFSDPATTRFGIAASNEDFGQTLGAWGWTPKIYLHIPVLGGSSERDMIGRAGDVLLDPATYEPASKASLRFNEISFSTRSLLGLMASDYDPYTLSKLYTTQHRAAEVADVPLMSIADDTPNTQTIFAMLFRPEDKDFNRRSRTDACHPADFVKPLPFTFWPQPKRAPIAYVMPGLGTHRIGGRCFAMAEIAHRAGYHVALFSNNFNWEFIQCAPEGYLPGYIDDDLKLIQRVQQVIATVLRHELGEGQVTGPPAQIGMSMGAWYALNLAAISPPDTYCRVLAVNPPLLLEHGLLALDRLYRAPLGGADLEAIQQSALLKLLALQQASLEAAQEMPFSDIEAAYMVGLNYRTSLGQTILSVHGHTRPSVEAYARANSYSHDDYYRMILSPRMAKRGISPETLAKAGDLRHRTEGLQRAADDIRVFLTTNDFLLKTAHVQWFKQTLGDRVRVHKTGGHMGQMWRPDVREALLEALQKSGS